MTMLQILEGPNVKMNLTIMISGSSYPKSIYNMPLVEKELKIQFKFEFKNQIELKKKRKQKKKGKGKKGKEEPRPSWAGFGQEAQLLLFGPSGQTHSAGATAREKKIGPNPTGH